MSRATSAKMMFPSSQLAGLVCAVVERDTRGATLTDAERFNYYPASPWALMSWMFEGAVQMVEPGKPGQAPKLGPPLPRLVFGGPHRHPAASWSPGPIHGIIVAFYPDALAALIGKPLEPFFDQMLPAEAVLPPALWEACNTLFEADRQSDPELLLEKALTPFWQEAHPTTPMVMVSDWMRSLVARAAYSKTGIGIRQIQRRIKHWTGQSQRELQRYAQIEQAMGHLFAHRQTGDIDIASLAAEAGYADQSHMGREVRRHSGFTPARFASRLERDEAFWFYRLLEGYLQETEVD